jgi:hypothetical protein
MKNAGGHDVINIKQQSVFYIFRATVTGIRDDVQKIIATGFFRHTTLLMSKRD